MVRLWGAEWLGGHGGLSGELTVQQSFRYNLRGGGSMARQSLLCGAEHRT